MLDSLLQKTGRSAAFGQGVKGGNKPCASCVGNNPLADHGQGPATTFKSPGAEAPTQIQGFHPVGDGKSKQEEARQTPGGQLSSPNDGTSLKTYGAITPQYQTRLAA